VVTVNAPRIAVDPQIRFGKPVIEGTRVPVSRVVGAFGGETPPLQRTATCATKCIPPAFRPDPSPRESGRYTSYVVNRGRDGPPPPGGNLTGVSGIWRDIEKARSRAGRQAAPRGSSFAERELPESEALRFEGQAEAELGIFYMGN
jgi:hypothetical protein